MVELLLQFGVDLRFVNNDGRAPFQHLFDDNVEQIRPIYETWTPHRMLPRWTPSEFPLYIECSSAFRDAIITLLLCLRRYRHVVPKEVGMRIVDYAAEMHRREKWFPLEFDMKPFM